ncbi:MAG: TIGR00297 family protein, partial [Dolichospermum sp.]
LQSKYAWITNEVVNIFNTFIGATSAIMMALIYQSIFV